MGRKFLGTIIILISIAILLHLLYLAPTIWEEAPKMWKHYKSDPDEFMMKDEMDTLLYWVLHLVIPAILIGTGRALRRERR
jgi:hypothetical protein